MSFSIASRKAQYQAQRWNRCATHVSRQCTSYAFHPEKMETRPMRATVHPPLHSERTLRCLVIATTFVLLCAQTDYASAVAPEAVPSACVTATDATADDLAERFTAEILSRHPDHMARLYAPDAALQGLASSALRTDYAGVREYFLYFLQYNPLVKFEERRLEVGLQFSD